MACSLERRFEAVVFDWDGTAVTDRRADASALRRVIEALCSAGMDVAIVSGTHVGNVDGQLAARPAGPGQLHLLMNRGSEVFRVGASGPSLVYRRSATPEEDKALSRAAQLSIERLASHQGFDAKVVSERLNRRKIDIIPEDLWADPTKVQIGELLAAVQRRLLRFGFALAQVVETVISAARDAGLTDPRVTSDAKFVEIGLTDKSESARWIMQDLWRRGIAPGLVLIAGDELGPLGGLPGSDSLMLVPEAERATVISVGVEPEGVPPRVEKLGGGSETFLRVLRDQLRRREQHDLPEIDGDPRWTLVIAGLDPLMERVRETQLTIADGRFGTRGSALLGQGRPQVLASGVYEGTQSDSRLVHCPLWNRLPQQVGNGTSLRRALDLRTGMLHEHIATASGQVEIVSFASFARPGTFGMRARGLSANLKSTASLEASDEEQRLQHVDPSGTWGAVTTTEDGAVVAAARQRRWDMPPAVTVDRFATYVATRARFLESGAALDRVGQAQQMGLDALLREHRAAWARRWEDADVVIEGDEELQRDVRFALFHLMASVPDSGEAPVGARGLSGPAYRGHVFWDADAFVLPFFAATHPECARAMLEYRLQRLGPAEARARSQGRAGARFPWESAAEGVEATPPRALDNAGRTFEVLTGELEEHVVADVAWAAACYVDWTGDEAFRAEAGARLLVETARYWASRVRVDGEGRAHIDKVVGPDEYHEGVDDDAFTNGMARWNLRRAASLSSRASDATPEELRRWLTIADTLVDGYDAKTCLYEQFAGFWRLEPLVIAEAAKSRPIAADVLLGHDRVRRAQVIKQPDVLMLHHMIADETAPSSLVPNLLYYEPRTAHGSSLSPGIHAALFARAWHLEEAVRWLRLTARIDLDDLSESTAGGLHLAAMGTVWQALAFGFAGIHPRADMLEIDPRLPYCWRALEVRVRFRGSRIGIRIEPEQTVVHADPPARIVPAGRAPVVVTSAGTQLAIDSRKEGRTQ